MKLLMIVRHEFAWNLIQFNRVTTQNPIHLPGTLGGGGEFV